MTRLVAGLVAITIFGSIPPVARAADHPGRLAVRDDAGLFTAEGIRAAETAFRDTNFPADTRLTVATVNAIPDDRKAAFETVKKDNRARTEFFNEWARELAKGDADKGVFVLLYDDGQRYSTTVIADRRTTDRRGFGPGEERDVSRVFGAGAEKALEKPSEDARPIMDAALLAATKAVAGHLKTVPTSTGGGPVAAAEDATPAASPVMGWVCMGLMILLGVWLVMGLIRALSGGGGGYGGGGYGGGGFIPSLLGGMFGAAAGMYMYDQFFGGGATDAAAGGATGLDGADAGNAGAGDWDGGSAGGDWGGDAGGGDFGGDW